MNHYKGNSGLFSQLRYPPVYRVSLQKQNPIANITMHIIRRLHCRTNEIKFNPNPQRLGFTRKTSKQVQPDTESGLMHMIK